MNITEYRQNLFLQLQKSSFLVFPIGLGINYISKNNIDTYKLMEMDI